MARSVDEWVAKHDDQAIPLKVRIRVFQRSGGICALSGKRVGPGEWDLDHIKALADGGEHRETNLQVVWRPKHREKTAVENSDRAKADRIWAKHNGVYPKSKTRWPKRDFAKSRRAVAVHDENDDGNIHETASSRNGNMLESGSK